MNDTTHAKFTSATSTHFTMLDSRCDALLYNIVNRHLATIGSTIVRLVPAVRVKNWLFPDLCSSIQLLERFSTIQPLLH